MKHAFDTKFTRIAVTIPLFQKFISEARTSRVKLERSRDDVDGAGLNGISREGRSPPPFAKKAEKVPKGSDNVAPRDYLNSFVGAVC